MTLKRCIFFMVAIVLAQGFSLPAFSSGDFSATCALYTDKEYVTKAVTYYPGDVFYMKVEAKKLLPGKYEMTAEWVNPAGRIERQDYKEFIIEDFKGSLSLGPWMKLWKNGFLTRAFTGREYKDTIYGEWKTFVYINGEQVCENFFTIH